MSGEPRIRTRYLPVVVVAAVVLSVGAAVAFAFIPSQVRDQVDFLDRAEPVEAVVVARDCSPGGYPVRMHCTNEVTYTFDGVLQRERRARWNRAVGDRLTVMVDPEDPTRFAVEGLDTGNGTLLAMAGASASLFALSAWRAVWGTPATARVASGELVFRPSATRSFVVALMGTFGALGGMVVAGATGLSDLAGVVLTLAGAVGVAVAAHLSWSNRSARLVVGPDRVAIVRRDGKARTSVALGPGSVWSHDTRGRRRSSTSWVSVSDGAATLTISPAMWGTALPDTVDRLRRQLPRSGARVVPWGERATHFPKRRWPARR